MGAEGLVVLVNNGRFDARLRGEGVPVVVHDRDKVIVGGLVLSPLELLEIDATPNVLMGATPSRLNVVPENSNVSVTVNSLMLMMKAQGMEYLVHGNTNTLTRDVQIERLST